MKSNMKSIDHLNKLLDARSEEKDSSNDSCDGELNSKQAIHLPHESYK